MMNSNITVTVLILCLWASSTSALTVNFIDVGQGDAILFEENGKYLLVDCGRSDTKIGSYLTSKGVSTIDYLITTHPDADHIGGCDYVLGNYNVTNVWDNGQPADTVAYQNYIALAHEKNYSVIYNGTLLDWNNVTVRILAPPEPYPMGNRNYNSIVAKVSYGSVDFMLTGDCTTECESRLSGNLSSEILKVGHHGSKYSTSQDFLDRVDPEVAVISVGATNPYGHPSQEVLDRLADNNIETHRTDLEGTIIVTTNGSTYSISPENCELEGDYPPCGEVTLAEVVDFIILWVDGKAELSDVVDLIVAWTGI